MRVEESGRREALEEVAKMDCLWIGSAIASRCLGVDRYYMNLMCKSENPPKFDFFFSGNRLKINRASFVSFCRGLGG